MVRAQSNQRKIYSLTMHLLVELLRKHCASRRHLNMDCISRTILRSSMQIRKIPLIQLQNLDPTSIRLFVDELECNGFAILKTDEYSDRKVILRTLADSQKMKTFRFPSHSEEIQYSEDQRQSFRTLFKWGRLCLRRC